MTVKPLKIGMLGAGTVGAGVYEILAGRINNPHRSIIVTKIAVRDTSKPREFNILSHTTITSDVNSILDDDEIELVVEVMGGVGVAKDFVIGALKRGKSVVTANKALIAENLTEIENLVHEMGGRVKFGFEAAVCGGIPIISVLQNCYNGDVINEIMGICNGTTNYMLGKMENGAEYSDVLAEAQSLGFAEADPTADVEGHDVRAKIAILARLAFGTTVPVESVPCTGITQISPIDFSYAKSMSCTIKLIGCARRLSQYGEYDGALSVYVTPMLVPNSHLLASASGAGNAVAVSSANLGITSYTGAGAGRFPTANSVVADICRVSSSLISSPFPRSSAIELDFDFISDFYIRISFQDSIGIIRRLGELAEKHEINISSVMQSKIHLTDCVVITEESKVDRVLAMCEDIAREDWVRCKPLCMPLLQDL